MAITAVYTIRDPETGTHFYCDQKSCGSNSFHFNASDVLVCNACELPARLRANVELIQKDFTQASDRILNERLS